MLYDNDDVLGSESIKGDTNRSRSLDLMSKKFCFEVLIILFFALSEKKDYKTCNVFMNRVKEWQPRVMKCLSEQDLQTLLRRQTDTVLQSQTIMYEMFCVSVPVKKANEQDFTQKDFYY